MAFSITQQTSIPFITWTRNASLISNVNMPLIRHQPLIGQLRGGAGGEGNEWGSSASDDIIASFKDELRKMREELTREAEMELEAMRNELRRTLGKSIAPKKMDTGEELHHDEDEEEEEEEEIFTDDEILHENDYELIEEEIEVEEEGNGEDVFDDNRREEKVDEEQLEQIQSNDNVEMDPVSNIMDGSENNIQDQGEELEDEQEQDEKEEDVNLEAVIGKEEDKVDSQAWTAEKHDARFGNSNNLVKEEGANDAVKQRNTSPTNYKFPPKDTKMDNLEIGESEEIDGNMEIFQKFPKETHAKKKKKKFPKSNTTKRKLMGKEGRKKKNESKKQKRKSKVLSSLGETEKGFESVADSILARQVALDTTPKLVSIGQIVKTIAPTMIILLLLLLSHFIIDAILKQISLPPTPPQQQQQQQ
jgi:hypothetical protein